MTAQEQILKFILPLISFGIISMVGMEIKLMIDVNTVQNQITTLREINYTKSDAVTDWRTQDSRDTGQSDRMNSIANRINTIEERLSKNPK